MMIHILEMLDRVVIFDILFKILKSKFSSVTYVRNITDIDDKIIKSVK